MQSTWPGFGIGSEGLAGFETRYEPFAEWLVAQAKRQPDCVGIVVRRGSGRETYAEFAGAPTYWALRLANAASR